MGEAGTPLATNLHRWTRMRSLVSSSTSKIGEEGEGEEEEASSPLPPPTSALDHSLSATAAARGHATDSRLLPSTISPHTHASPLMTSEATPCGGPQETGGVFSSLSSSSERSKLLFRETCTAAVVLPLSPPRPPLRLLPPFIPSVGSTAYLFFLSRGVEESKIRTNKKRVSRARFHLFPLLLLLLAFFLSLVKT